MIRRPDHRRRPRATARHGVIVAGALTVVLAGCTPAADDSAPSEPTASERAPSQADDPIATVEAPAVVPGDPEATITANLHSLRRTGDAVVGTYSFRVETAGSTAEQNLAAYLGKGWQPELIDPANRVKYEQFDWDTSRPASTANVAFAPGTTFYAYAVFPAPPEDVGTLDVALVAGAPLVTGVELE